MKVNSSTKEGIKSVLQSGGKIVISHKYEISQWYHEASIHVDKDTHNTFYIIQPKYIKFVDIDDAVDYFCDMAYTSKNIGYIQNRLMDNGILSDDVDLENPNEEIINLFKEEGKIVDEEAKILNIKIKKFPTKSSAKKYFIENIIENFNIDNINEKIKEFQKKYMVINSTDLC